MARVSRPLDTCCAVGDVVDHRRRADARCPSATAATTWRVRPRGPSIITGSDVRLGLERVRDGVPIGVLLVRVDGRWVTPQPQ
jgi:hypothetical protein